jgi:nucleoside-diphosphate-sugar epimerase
MPHAFLTGGTGFLGRNLAEVLSAAGWQVTALVRNLAKAEPLTALGLNIVEAGLDKPEILIAVMSEGVDVVFHVAADTSLWRGHRARQWRANVEGTRNMLRAAKEKGAGRFVHTSTIAVYGHQKEGFDETAEKRGLGSWIGYVNSKSHAEAAVLEAAADGLDAVVLNPGHILGRYDSHNWASMFRMVRDDTLPGVPPGAGSFANVSEVAKAHLRAAEVGASGKNYLLGGPHETFLAVIREIARILEIEPPEKTLPAWAIKTAARLKDLTSRITGKPPDLTPEGAYLVCQDENFSSRKAQDQLDYRTRPIADSLIESFAWLKEEGKI